MTYEKAYDLLVWCHNNFASETAFVAKFKEHYTTNQLRLVYTCLNKTKDVIDTKRLAELFDKSKEVYDLQAFINARLGQSAIVTMKRGIVVTGTVWLIDGQGYGLVDDANKCYLIAEWREWNIP